jgi:hypothetical protein
VVAPGGKAVYSSPSIRLLPGFAAMTGGYFHADQYLPNPFVAARGEVPASVTEAPPREVAVTAPAASGTPIPQRLTAGQLPAGLRQWLRRGGVAPEQVAPAVADGAGQLILFATDAALFTSDANGVSDVYAYRPADDILFLVSHTPTGQAGDGPSDWPVIDGLGRQVLFQSAADDLTAADGNGVRDLFLFDTASGALQNLTVGDTGASAHPALDAAGQWALYDRLGDDGRRSIRLLDLRQGLPGEPVSSALGDSHHPAISPEGRYSLWLEGEQGVRFRDHWRGVEQQLPCPPQLRPYIEQARAFFGDDGAKVEWLIEGAGAPLVMDNPLYGG